MSAEHAAAGGGAPGDGGAPSRTGRSRDAAASKQALLRAAQELFGQQGFERTTIREIGERAGVDAALIARYFGNKAELYVAAVVAEDAAVAGPAAFSGLAQIAETLVRRADERGPGPILQALIRSDTLPEIRVAAGDRIARRVVEPLADDIAGQHLDRPRLRAEVAVAALYGISLGRSLGWFEEIRSVPRADLLALVTEALTALTAAGGGVEASGGGGADGGAGAGRAGDV
ncbi:putative TetR family transcriptional regulator [Actinacidiphila reveromycinica]|uniref:Putative TetR family transcriptional regulator n=1 Tax=Actinacidiphila reveromycinica TaxID=659352 RepID=A0A7U3VQD3_9ACTN|nr:TetR/AcrR family transcriptional regulator [Streptomyces sp. SN-593]BBA99529.1 putative TetR family transcriptional regulator [Streptomyces sp. SN-593]